MLFRSVAKDSDSKKTLDEIERTADIAKGALEDDGALGLTDAQRAEVRELAGGGGDSPFDSPIGDDELDIPVDTGPPPASQTAARGEDSVLFSLGNLQSLATQSASSDAESGQASRPLFDETSGLVDIRSMTLSQEEAESRGLTELLNMDAGGTAGLAPVLAPEKKERRALIPIGIAAGVVVVGAVVAVVLLTGGEKQEAGGDEELNEQIAVLMQELEDLKAAGDPEDAEKMAALEHELEEKKAEAAAADEGAGEADEKPAAVAKAGGKKKGGGDRAGAAPAKKSSGGGGGGAAKSGGSKASSSGAKGSKPGGGASELDALLGGSAAPKKKKPSGGGGAPASLSKSQVMAGMKAVAGAVKACGKGAGGKVTVQATITPGGRIASARALGSHAGTPVGKCVERAVRRARFPKSQKKLKVKYPFRL